MSETTPPIELVNKATPDKVIAWACGECGIVCPSEQVAKGHCAANVCDCGNFCAKHYTACPSCIKDNRAKKDLKKREAAEVVSADDYDGPVYWDQADEYFPDAAEAFDAVSDRVDFDAEEREAQTLWTCRKAFLTMDANDIISGELESQEHHDEAYNAISQKGVNVLQKLLDGWIEEHAGCVETWFPVEKKRIVFPQKWWTDHDEPYKDTEGL